MKSVNFLELTRKEQERQNQTIRLIPSENYTFEEVLTLLGSSLTNKYSEGYPGRRYYEGQTYVDQIETATIDLAQTVFNIPYVNVQPYSGSPANMAVYAALASPGDTIMGLSLDAGGHLTHGHHASLSGKWFNSVSYGLDPETLRIDYEYLEYKAREHQPQIIISGLSAYPRAIDFERIGRIARDVGAYHVADISHISGLVAGGFHQSPIPHADVITTTTHKMLRGPRGALILSHDETIAKRINKAVFPGLQGGPHMNNIAGIGYTLQQVLTKEFFAYLNQIRSNTEALAEALHNEGFALITGGSDNHLLLLDLREENVDGTTLSRSLIEANISTNKNSIPFDDASPMHPNGLRVGTPAITTLGMTAEHMPQIARFIRRVAENTENPSELHNIQTEVKDFMAQFTN